MIVEAVVFVARQIARVGHDVGRQRRHLPEHVGDVGIGHVRPHVDVRELYEPSADEARRQMTHRQIQVHELEPVRFPLPGVEAQPQPSGAGGNGGA